jgi:hypothetical protein
MKTDKTSEFYENLEKKGSPEGISSSIVRR